MSGASFEERSVWIQLISIVLGLGAYFACASVMMSHGVLAPPAYIPLFGVAVVLIVAINIVGHIAAALASRPEGPDERDRLIEWRADAKGGLILGFGVFAAIGAIAISVEPLWVAHLLLGSVFIAEVGRCSLQLWYYRRGI